MQEPDLHLFDLQNLVTTLNASLRDPNEVITLGKFESKTPKKNPFIYRFYDRELETVGKFPLRQNTCGSGLIGGLLGLESEVSLGYIFVETGYAIASENGGRRYETLKLRTKRPIELKEGITIPKCNVKILREAEECTTTYQERRDHEKFGPFWISSRLRDVLPSDWFYREQ
jgi:hypothetical protein